MRKTANAIWPYLLAILTGASLVFGYAPFSLWYLPPLLIAVFIYLLARPQVKRPGLLGFCFGIGWFGAGISWVHVAISEFGGLPLIGSLGLMALLSAYLALFPAFTAKILHRYFAPGYWPLVLPAFWLVMEWLRSWLFTGFPWLSVGYSQLGGPLAGWMPVIGETGVSLLLVLAACIIALLLPQKRWLPLMTSVAILYGSGWSLQNWQWTAPQQSSPEITMVQGNIAQSLRWVPEQDWPTMEKYWDMTEQHWNSDIIIWPEAAIPKLEPLAQEYIVHMDELAAKHQSGLITGIVNYDFDSQQAWNSLIAIGLKDSGEQNGQYRYMHGNRYDKHHLLPIGEFIPMEDWLRGLAPIFDLPMSSFSRGGFQQHNLVTNGYHIAPAICFEIAFPRQLSANLTDETDFILTVSNDAWFGDSHGPAQHLQIAQARAKEFAMPVLRATNNGITAFIDYQGEIVKQAPQFEQTTVTAQIQPRHGNTPYRLWGDSINWLLSLLALGLAVWWQRKSS